MLSILQQFINLLTHFLLREDYFPLTLTLSPIGGEGEKAEPILCLMVTKPGDIVYSLSTRFGGRGLG